MLCLLARFINWVSRLQWAGWWNTCAQTRCPWLSCFCLHSSRRRWLIVSKNITCVDQNSYLLIYVCITSCAVAQSRVLRTAWISYGNMENSTRHSSETSWVITMKLCKFDKVRETNTCAKFGWNPPARGRSTHTWNIHFLWLLFFSAFLPSCLLLAHLNRPNGNR